MLPLIPGFRMSGEGRVRPPNALNSLPEACRSSWAAIKLTFVQTGSRLKAACGKVNVMARQLTCEDPCPQQVVQDEAAPLELRAEAAIGLLAPPNQTKSYRPLKVT